MSFLSSVNTAGAIPDNLGSLIDGFEDGDTNTAPSEWENWGSSVTPQQNTVLEGNWSGEIANNGKFLQRTAGSFQPNVMSFRLRINSQSGSSSSEPEFHVRNGSGNRIFGVIFNGVGNIESSGGGGIGKWSAGVDYLIIYKNIDFSNETYGIEVKENDTGNLIVDESGISFKNSASNVVEWQFRIDDMTGQIDEVRSYPL